MAGGETLAVVRRAVRGVVEGTPELRGDPELSRRIAERMVGVSLAAAELIAEERRLSHEIDERRARRGRGAALAQAQAAGDIHRRTAVDSAPDVLRRTRDAIDFPNFVTSLISGVFQSIQSSSIQQLQAFADLLDAVNSSTSDFATSQIGAERAASWAVNRFDAFAIEREGEEVRLVLRDDRDLPEPEELARALAASEDEVSSIDGSELTETLLPLVRRKLARDRQSMLATMVLMGMQRVVVDDGAIHASMQLQVDARSTAEQRQAERLDTRVETEASGSFGVGAWGASARLSASVGYVKSDDQFTREDIAVSAGLRSSVDLRFRTVPLEVRRLADDRTLDRIRDRSMVPATERAMTPGGLLASQPERVTAAPTLPTPSAPGSQLQRGGTMEEARRAREDAARREGQASPQTGAATPRPPAAPTPRPPAAPPNPPAAPPNPPAAPPNPPAAPPNPPAAPPNPPAAPPNPPAPAGSGTAPPPSGSGARVGVVLGPRPTRSVPPSSMPRERIRAS
jgi:hypothetical protein